MKLLHVPSVPQNISNSNFVLYSGLTIPDLILSYRIPGDNKSSRFFIYGGIGMLCSPLNDAWILHVKLDKGRIYWEQIDLSYDHGEVRCWHTAVCMSTG